ncbi:MAG: SDR family oxidoreductase [Saprospiraceae bacterium]|nr:SDR family oxidoreductase [Saprospiraceae bacterium]MBK9722430.1 SDR family oxidoreductase [Saprospiraceae bacterium]
MNAVITGASKGLGKAIAIALVQKGFNVFIHSRSEGDLDKVKQELLALNPKCKVFYFACDISNKDAIKALAISILSVFREVDILINNAGVYLPGTISAEPEGTLEQLLNTNLYSAYHLTRAILPNMLHRNSGHIFNMCSIASLDSYPGGSSYCISKFALLGFSKCLREELKDKGIRVTSILPGATWSDSWKGANLPADRIMQATDVAKIVLCAIELSPSAVLEEIIVRPQLGDL